MLIRLFQFLFIFLFSSSFVLAQTTYVPDNNFENYLEANGMGDGIALNDSVLTSNINAVTNLDVNSLFISSLTGIEDFISLEYLDCSGNFLTNISVNQLPSLRNLKCFNKR